MIARNSKIHSFGRSFNGFAARLLPHEAKLLAQKEGVVSVFPNRVKKLLTTRSWDFVGLREKVTKRNNQTESDIIVAVFDTGIWVESPSFNDTGYGPPPKKWNGTCETGANFTGCNNKVIGAQYFNHGQYSPEDIDTPLDLDGHGTHTASTAAGIPVKGASLFGLARGTARGGVPSARIASYKVCWGFGCQDVDIMAAFDAAIADGVDIISISIGGDGSSFTEDPIAIGAFHALKKGIMTVCAAGNEGPALGTLQNVAPWVFTVAASTTDRRFETSVKLGNGQNVSGIAVNTFVPKKDFYPLINGALAKNDSIGISGNPSDCDPGTLSRIKVKGKIVLCQGSGGEAVVQELGGAGIIMSQDVFRDTAFITTAPGTYVSLQDGQKINNYINSTRSALGVIYKTRTVKIIAPTIASFSSRGPQRLGANILKPDIAAPGVNILAAFTKFTTVTGRVGDKRVVTYNVESGTSMACPHVSAAVAYVKSFHPNWSPAAIKSALMTTARAMKIKPQEAELASGSGQINPKAALHPGLIYDIKTNAYAGFLCKQGYRSEDVALITGSKKYNCSNMRLSKGADGLNYPSINLQVRTNETVISAVFHRNVKNVGLANSTYKAKVIMKGISITVRPNILTFNKRNQRKSFKVILRGKLVNKGFWYLSGSLVWRGSNSKHRVRSPIFVSPPV
ncbi:hypothetical protein ACS0TY_016561 [Phlomoides rotata]